MSMDFYNTRTYKAKKQHNCEMCFQKIEIGDIYVY